MIKTIRYWVFFYTFTSPDGRKGTGFTHLETEGAKHVSISRVKADTAKMLEEEHSIKGIVVGLTSFNELSKEDYEYSL
jgi:hypothetical protein